MKLKITGHNKERFEENLLNFLNMATLICHKGYIPTQYDIDNADRLGNWWSLDKEQNKYYILGGSNNIWLAILEETETSKTVEFSFRYDSKREKEFSISNVLLAFLDYVELVE